MNDATHLDDEQLSALLDGEATAGEAAHASSCAPCSERLARFRAVAAVVALPPPPPAAAERDRAVATALAAREVVPLRPARSAGAPAWLAAAAAVVILALLAVPVLRAGGRDDADEAASGGAESAEEGGAGAGTAPAGEEGSALSSQAAPPPFDGGDVGELSADSDLRPLVAPAAPEPAAGAPGAPARDGAERFSAPSCEPAVRAAEPDLGVLRFVATATFEGRPAQVLAFDEPGTGGTAAFVVAADTCDQFRRQSF